jgi:hypothetical protein
VIEMANWSCYRRAATRLTSQARSRRCSSVKPSSVLEWGIYPGAKTQRAHRKQTTCLAPLAKASKTAEHETSQKPTKAQCAIPSQFALSPYESQTEFDSRSVKNTERQRAPVVVSMPCRVMGAREATGEVENAGFQEEELRKQCKGCQEGI